MDILGLRASALATAASATVNVVVLPAGHGGAAVSCQHRQLRIPPGAEVPAGGSSPICQDEEGCNGENRAAGPETWSVFE